jgi:ribonuclease HII
MDEAGRGPWAGPVAAAAVMLPLERDDLPLLLKGIKDSKQMTPLQRQNAVETIKTTALTWGIGSASPAEINTLGLTAALKLAMQRALDQALTSQAWPLEYLLLDFFKWPEMAHIQQKHLKGGDQVSLSIAAASVLAKTWRDAYMDELAQQYPHYGFEQHKGYGTTQHHAALKKYGVSAVHRHNYRPIAALLKPTPDHA